MLRSFHSPDCIPDNPHAPFAACCLLQLHRRAGRAGGRRRNAAPQQLGDLKAEERGEERRCTPCQHPSIGIIPTGGQKRWARTRSERGWCFPRLPSTQALTPRPGPHAPETVLPLPAEALVRVIPSLPLRELRGRSRTLARKLRGKARAGGAADSARVPILRTHLRVSWVPATCSVPWECGATCEGSVHSRTCWPCALASAPARSCPAS